MVAPTTTAVDSAIEVETTLLRLFLVRGLLRGHLMRQGWLLLHHVRHGRCPSLLHRFLLLLRRLLWLHHRRGRGSRCGQRWWLRERGSRQCVHAHARHDAYPDSHTRQRWQGRQRQKLMLVGMRVGVLLLLRRRSHCRRSAEAERGGRSQR
jgi:hypothetical protein